MPEFTLTVADDKLADIDGVAAAAERVGLRVDQVHAHAGIISGTADDDCAPTLRSIDGVDAVETSHTFRVAPPDSPIQ